jgi:hypothetical protein
VGKRYIYLVIDQENEDIPVFTLKKEHGQGPPRTVHRNLLLPFLGLPLNSPKENISSHESCNPLNRSVSSSNILKSNLPSLSSSTEKYVIPQRRKSTLNPCAEPFYPNRPTRSERKPAWLPSTDWIT